MSKAGTRNEEITNCLSGNRYISRSAVSGVIAIWFMTN